LEDEDLLERDLDGEEFFGRDYDLSELEERYFFDDLE
jgi:hypothetical protein